VVSSAILAERDAEIAALKATVAAGADAAAERDVLADALENQASELKRVAEALDAVEGRNGALEAQVAALASSADPADDTTLRLRVAELEARNSTLEAQAREDADALATRVGEASALQRRVDELAPLLAAEQEARAADVARLQGELERARADLETEAQRVASEAESVERDKGEQVAELEELRTSRRRLTRRTSEFSQTMKTLFAISDHIHDELVAGDDDDAKLGMMQQLLPVKVEELVAQRVTEAAASSVPTGDVAALEAKLAAAEAALRENAPADVAALEQKLAAAEAARDAAQKEADGAVDDLADLEDRLFAAEAKLKKPPGDSDDDVAPAPTAADLSPASLSADEGIMAAIMAERDMLKTRLKEQEDAVKHADAVVADAAAVEARHAREIEGREESLRQLAADADGAAEEAARAAAALAEAREPLERVTAERDAAVSDVRTVYADFQELQAQAQAMYGELEAARAQLAAAATAPATPGPFDGGAAPAPGPFDAPPAEFADVPLTPAGGDAVPRGEFEALQGLLDASNAALADVTAANDASAARVAELVAAAEEAETDRKYRKKDSLRAFENAVKKLEAAEASAAEKQRAIDALEAGAEAAAARVAELEAARRPVFDAAAALPGFPATPPAPGPFDDAGGAAAPGPFDAPAGEPAPDLKEALSIVESCVETNHWFGWS
jgi:hypothetical protein